MLPLPPYIMKPIVAKVIFLREVDIDSSAEEEMCDFTVTK